MPRDGTIFDKPYTSRKEYGVPRMPRVTAREVERAIMRDGWRHVGGSGSHRQYEHRTKTRAVTVAFHGNQIVAPGTLSNILRQAGLTVSQFSALL